MARRLTKEIKYVRLPERRIREIEDLVAAWPYETKSFMRARLNQYQPSSGILNVFLESFLSFLGPGGLATPDDVEALESCQDGFGSGGVEWNDISRGMTREPKATDEEQMRAFWRRWREQVSPQREAVS